MQLLNEHLIQIRWNGPYKFSDLASLKNDDTDYGIYQIYGKHSVYGDNVLLYIGQANQQTFGTRIMQHSYWLEDNFSVYVGRLCGPNSPTEDDWTVEINRAESLLIYVHSPAYNKMNIDSVNYSELQDLHIINLGEYKNLLPELSGARWIDKNNYPDDIYRLSECE